MPSNRTCVHPDTPILMCVHVVLEFSVFSLNQPDFVAIVWAIGMRLLIGRDMRACVVDEKQFTNRSRNHPHRDSRPGPEDIESCNLPDAPCGWATTYEHLYAGCAYRYPYAGLSYMKI